MNRAQWAVLSKVCPRADFKTFRCLVGLALFAATVPAQAPTVALRLETALSTHGSKAAMPFQAVVTAPVEWNDLVLMPAGTVVHGVVKRSRRVGMGLVRDRASLELDFREYELPGNPGDRLPFRATLSEIENARESVHRTGRIEGILVTNNPQSLLSGVWYRFKPGMIGKGLAGLTGAGGFVWTRYSMGPAGAVGLLALRIAALKLPEPEIRLPKGAELRAWLVHLPETAPSFERPETPEVSEELAEWIRAQRSPVQRPDGGGADDLVNVVIEGSQDEVVRAFAAAGWSQPDGLNRRTFAKAYRAYARQTGYARAPVSKLTYEGAEPGLVFQKSLNTIAKRHHIRLWRVDRDGATIWLGAATQDIGISFDGSSFTHKIEMRIDLERDKVVNDLAFTRCARPSGYVTREWMRKPGLPGVARSGPITDGRAAVLNVSACTIGPVEPLGLADPPLPGTRLTRTLRRVVLETKHYFARSNVYYWTFRGIQKQRKRAVEVPAFAWSPVPQERAAAIPEGDEIKEHNQ